MGMITCPECSTEYEKEAKYCFKCRIPFTDDIPDNIKKYLKPRGGSSGTTASNPGGIGNRTNTTPLAGSGVDKPPLQRNVSLPVFKNSASNQSNSSLNSNNILISSSSPPNNNHGSGNNSNTHSLVNSLDRNNSINSGGNSSSNLLSGLSSTVSPPINAGSGSRPRLQSTPTPPSHPLPPVPNRMSVPVAHSPPTVMNISSNNTSRQPPPPPNNKPNTPTTSAPTNIRTISPVTASLTSPDNMSPQLGFTDEHPSNNFIKRPLSRRIPPPPPNKKLVRAVWDCIPEQEGDLEFYVGDIISVITKDDESGWWMGTSNGRTGLFPANYVEEMDN
ncbi:hypothetical protein PPL_04528 [Heterostelium album PN500]|uniref:SH3 domain-containing protein n=1 Tax=Heterostelium pallidum (strain ATCC 26659 / Pp 5 / PN500) TaxID=670386 RepID=D3B7U0_HETP5|nr:hypothetical protein PPL_04528 [Heterostelium album PN500]EFA82833.1 hypothetical protein PPL_04528 [Heterostelium album PN500]|eukprot:XP_020434950.1 hypothetical protein PPL_04528 [Heterostelium album PN500]